MEHYVNYVVVYIIIWLFIVLNMFCFEDVHESLIYRPDKHLSFFETVLV